MRLVPLMIAQVPSIPSNREESRHNQATLPACVSKAQHPVLRSGNPVTEHSPVY